MPPWVKGQSGNPGGRAKLAEKVKKRAMKAVDTYVLKAWLDEVREKDRGRTRDDGTPILEKGRDWVKCSELLASYGIGKPTQAVELSGPEGKAMEVNHGDLDTAHARLEALAKGLPDGVAVGAALSIPEQAH